MKHFIMMLSENQKQIFIAIGSYSCAIFGLEQIWEFQLLNQNTVFFSIRKNVKLIFIVSTVP